MSEHKITHPRGRGVARNPTGRFESREYHPDPASAEDRIPTQIFKDSAKSIIATNQSPDLRFDASLNPYRGCEHGCAYCYARPYHEYLGFSAGLDFETKIVVKENAAELLRKELSRKSWTPKTLAMSGVTDAYQPLEKELRVTRSLLEVLVEFRNPVGIVTKNQLVTRDLDLLSELADHQAAAVYLSINSLDAKLARRLEPRTSSPRARLAALTKLRDAGVPAGVLVGPVIPGINDHEIPAVLEAAAEAGASFASYVFLRLPHGVADLFEDWLEEHEPGRRSKVMNKVLQAQGGRPSSQSFGVRMKGQGALAAQIGQLFEINRRRVGIAAKRARLSTGSFRDPAGTQGTLFQV